MGTTSLELLKDYKAACALSLGIGACSKGSYKNLLFISMAAALPFQTRDHVGVIPHLLESACSAHGSKCRPCRVLHPIVSATSEAGVCECLSFSIAVLSIPNKATYRRRSLLGVYSSEGERTTIMAGNMSAGRQGWCWSSS